MEGPAKIYHSGKSKRKQDNHAQTSPVAAKFEDCHQCFTRLCVALKEHASPFDIDLAKDSFARFQAWGHDTGAMTRSLDHTLRKASDHQKKTLELLTTLHSTLVEVIEHLRDVAQAFNDRIEDVSDNAELAKETISSEQASNTDPGILALTEETSELIENIDGIVVCLIRLVPSLRDPFPLDLYSRDASISDAYPDIDLARELFPRASLALIERLGRAHRKRRQYLKMVQEKNYPSIPIIKAKKSANRQKKTVLREVAVDAFNFQKPALKVGSFQPHNSQWPAANRSISGASTAPSVVDTEFSRHGFTRNESFTSLAQSETPVKRLQVPKPPVPLAQGQAFLCLYCRNEIDVGDNIKTDKDWERHVFGDLEPYLCTFDDCLRAEKTYGGRDDWFRHELENHRIMKVWFCQTCVEEFITVEKFEAHLQEKHENIRGPHQVAMMVSLCVRHSQKHLEEQMCPLCAERVKGRALKEHISDHLEQLALTSVNGDDSSEEDDSDEIVSQNFDDTVSEGRTKLEILHAFAEEQFGYIHPGGQEPPEKGSDVTDPDSVGDSEEENSQGSAGRPVARVERDWRVLHLQGEPIDQAMTTNNPIKRNRSPRAAATGLNAPGPRSSESVTSQPLIRTASYPYNDEFMGRESDLANLYKILSVPGRLCIVNGTGGMGKTATAVEFSYRYEHAFNCIFWVQAETRVGLVDTYTLIATNLGLAPDGTDQDRMVELSRRFLDKTEKKWLLVFDNVDNWADMEDYLPEKTSRTNGSILITTRNPDLAPAPIPVNYYMVNLKELRMEEGRSLLIKGLRPDLKHDHVQRHSEYRIAGEIASLAGLPLAIIHISGYVKASGCTLAEFWELWNEWRRNNLLSGASGDISNSDNALEMVWNIGLRDLGVDALKVLKIMAFLDSDAIQKDLLINDHAAPSLAFLHSSLTYRCRKIIHDLSSRRLITVKTHENRDTYSIHRLLQHRLLQDMNTNGQESYEIFCLAFELVRERLPRPSTDTPEPAKWNVLKEYLPHVLCLQRVYSDGLSIITPFLGLSELFRDGGVLLWQRYISTDALKLLNSAETILDKLGCDEAYLRVDIHITTNLLIQYFGISHRAESRDRLQKILEFRLKTADQAKPGTSTRIDEALLSNAWADYANALLQFNNYKGAEPIYQKCYKKCLEWGPEQDNAFECAKLNHHMAYCHMYRRDFVGAIKLAERAMDLVVLVGGDKQLPLRYQFDLACIILQGGNIERSLEIHKQILTARLDLQGRASYFTLQSYYAVGALCSYLGKLDEAEQLMRTALARAQERGGRNFWPEAAVARTKFHLHQILTEKGTTTAETEAFAVDARAVLSRLLPFDPLDGVKEEDEGALFDHLQPIFGGRFTGLTLIKYVS